VLISDLDYTEGESYQCQRMCMLWILELLYREEVQKKGPNIKRSLPSVELSRYDGDKTRKGGKDRGVKNCAPESIYTRALFLYNRGKL